MRPTPPEVTDAAGPAVHDRPTRLRRIAVGVDGRPECRDAACLAMMIAAATGGGVMLVAVDTAPPVALPPVPDWTETRERVGNALRELRDSLAPGAQTVVETDSSVARALERVASREHRDLLVVGSSHLARQGRVRIGRRTRQLLGDARCAAGGRAEGAVRPQPAGAADDRGRL